MPLTYLSIGQAVKWPLPNVFPDPLNDLFLSILQCILIIPILALNAGTFTDGFSGLTRGAPNKKSLIATGATACLLFSIFSIIGLVCGLAYGIPDVVDRYIASLYFEPAAIILTLISLELFLEERAKGQISEVIVKLKKLQPDFSVVYRDGVETRVPTSDIMPGDLVRIQRGQHIPVDGIITEGNSLVDVSAITGVPIPVEKHCGDPVWSATINLSEPFTFRAEKVGNDTILAQLIQMVERSNAAKKPVPQHINAISTFFIPVIFLSFVVTIIVWLLDGASPEFAFSNGIAVLIIACPSALGLAIPTAMVFGTGVAAKHGLRIKTSRALQLANAVDTIIIEKNGIISVGRPGVTDIVSITDLDHNEFLALAASIQKLSAHPLSVTIVNEAEKSGLTLTPVRDFQASPGKGVSCTIRDKRYVAGSPDYLQENGISMAELEPDVGRLALNGKIPFCFGGDGKPLGIIAVADTLKVGSREAITAFQAIGIEVIMMSGDNPRTAEGLKRTTGIGRILTALMPEDKVQFIKGLQADGRTVAMIGDGINDIPAMVSADVAIAVTKGMEISIDAADIVLLRSDLRDAVTALRLGKKVIRNIHENLIWAIAYNTLAIPLAAGAFYARFGWHLTPLIATAVMTVSAVSMILNASRLYLFRKEN